MTPIKTGDVDIEALAAKSREAARRIASIACETPLEASLALSKEAGISVLLKLEHLQRTGSFKLRGAAAKLTSLDEAARKQGVITASTGNHGLAVTYASLRTAAPAPKVFVPETADPGKVARLRAAGAEVVISGPTCVDAETAAREEAVATGRAYVSPYNDDEVMAGQGTVGLEIARAAGERGDALDIYVAVGGGGLIGGIAAAVKATFPRARIIGCLPESSAAMIASVRAGHIVEAPELPTLSDATAGGLEAGSVTFPVCRALVDEWLAVSEDEIKGAWQRLFAAERWVVEGAAAVAVAALFARDKRRDKPRDRGEASRTAVLVLCGRNVSAAQIATLAG